MSGEQEVPNPKTKTQGISSFSFIWTLVSGKLVVTSSNGTVHLADDGNEEDRIDGTFITLLPVAAYGTAWMISPIDGRASASR
jgi:hypothetical protein